MDPKPVVFDISSDEEGWGETATGGAGDDDYGWISELFGDEKEADDSDDLLLLGEMVFNPKQTLKSAGVINAASVKDLEDDDCVVLDGDPDKPLTIENNTADESDDLLVVGEKGQIACRDYPHPRHLCAKFSFTSTPHERHCDLCHCYVCDSQAPCIHWGTGGSNADHCHATDKEEFWKLERKNFKQGDKALMPVHKSQDASLSVGLNRLNQFPPPMLPNIPAWNCASRPTIIRACSTSTNSSVSKMRSQVRSHQSAYIVPKNKFQPHLPSKQLHSTCSNNVRRERRHGVNNLGPQFLSADTLFKRTGSVGVALPTSRRSGYSSSNNNYGSPTATSVDKNPIRFQNLCGGMTSGQNAHQRFSQQNTGSILVNSLPSQGQVPLQPNIGSVFVNSVPPQPQVPSQPSMGNVFVNPLPPQPQASSQPNMGSMLEDSVSSLPQISSQPNICSNFGDSVPCQPQISSQPSMDSDSANLAHLSQPQAFSQLVLEACNSQDDCYLRNQTNPLNSSFSDFDSWVTPTSQCNQQPQTENSSVQNMGAAYNSSLNPELGPQFPECTNLGSLDFQFDSWILGNHSVNGALEVSVPPGLNVLSPEPADSGALFDF